MSTSRFRDVTLEWEGKSYTIPANRIFGAIARIEEHIFLSELSQAAVGNLSFTKASRAWAALLDYAGCKGVNPEDVYADMFSEGPDGQKRVNVLMGFRLLELIMLPPPHLVPPQDDNAPGKGKPTAAASLNTASARPSAKSGSRKKISGRSRR
jgi:hypothetical protein